MEIAYQSTLFSATGKRKYLCASELPRFLEVAGNASPELYSFCRLLAYTGCRISEALALSVEHLDPETGHVVFRTLKRRRLVFRAVPIPPDLMEALRVMAKGRSGEALLWSWCRVTAWRKVTTLMAQAGIEGPQAMPKGLRHCFGVCNAENNIPMATTQKWLGHASLETTAIYQQAVGSEERAFAQRLWRQWQPAAD